MARFKRVTTPAAIAHGGHFDGTICVGLPSSVREPLGLSYEGPPNLERATARTRCARVGAGKPVLLRHARSVATAPEGFRVLDTLLPGDHMLDPNCLSRCRFSSRMPNKRQPLVRRPRVARRTRPAGPRQRSRHRRSPLASRARHRLRASMARGERRRHPPGLAARAAAGQRRSVARLRRARRPHRRTARSRHAGAGCHHRHAASRTRDHRRANQTRQRLR